MIAKATECERQSEKGVHNKMSVIKKDIPICGELALATIFRTDEGQELVRFQATGSWSGPQDTTKANKHMLVEHFPDGSFTVTMQKLAPVSIASDKDLFTEEGDKMLNAIEEELGLEPDTLSSASYYAGYQDAQWDSLMTKKEQTIIGIT